MRRRALVALRRPRPLGGAENAGAWMIQALVDDHDVTLACLEPPDLLGLDRRAGTRLRDTGLAVAHLPDLPLAGLLRADNLRSWAFQKRVREMAPAFDVVLDAEHEADLGEGAAQYIHNLPDWPFRPRGGLDLGWYHAVDLRSLAYFAAAARWTGFDVERMRRNRTLVCSDFIGAAVRRAHGIVTTTVHPPAIAQAETPAWAAREDRFVWAGRLWRDRRVEVVIEIVERVRARGLAVRLDLLGAPHDLAYTAEIRRLAAARSSWLTLRENVDRAEAAALMASARYGLHATREEPFGMAPAELVASGCIVFVPDGGGQVEIVGREPRLLYRTAAEAAEKIALVLRSPVLQAKLTAELSRMRSSFCVDRFKDSFRAALGLSPSRNRASTAWD